MRLPESSSISPSVRDALAIIHRQALELIVQGASLEMVLDALCDGINALDPDLISSVLLADPDGQRLWPKAGRRVPEDWKKPEIEDVAGLVAKTLGTSQRQASRSFESARAPRLGPQ